MESVADLFFGRQFREERVPTTLKRSRFPGRGGGGLSSCLVRKVSSGVAPATVLRSACCFSCQAVENYLILLNRCLYCG